MTFSKYFLSKLMMSGSQKQPASVHFGMGVLLLSFGTSSKRPLQHASLGSGVSISAQGLSLSALGIPQLAALFVDACGVSRKQHGEEKKKGEEESLEASRRGGGRSNPHEQSPFPNGRALLKKRTRVVADFDRARPVRHPALRRDATLVKNRQRNGPLACESPTTRFT